MGVRAYPEDAITLLRTVRRADEDTQHVRDTLQIFAFGVGVVRLQPRIAQHENRKPGIRAAGGHQLVEREEGLARETNRQPLSGR